MWKRKPDLDKKPYVIQGSKGDNWAPFRVKMNYRLISLVRLGTSVYFKGDIQFIEKNKLFIPVLSTGILLSKPYENTSTPICVTVSTLGSVLVTEEVNWFKTTQATYLNSWISQCITSKRGRVYNQRMYFHDNHDVYATISSGTCLTFV